jgi:hypothetical protein
MAMMPLDPPVTVDTDSGSVVCHQAGVNVAIGTGVNIRLTPIGPDGTPYPRSSIAILGRESDPDVQVALQQIAPIFLAFVEGRRR